jgi:hypothetical protein
MEMRDYSLLAGLPWGGVWHHKGAVWHLDVENDGFKPLK